MKVAKHIWHPCCHLVSISPTFYEQLLRQSPFAKKLQTQIVSTLKVRKQLWYEIAAHKVLVNDSHTKVLCTAFKCLQFGFVVFWQKDFGAKAAHKMLVKLTPGDRMGPRYVLQYHFMKNHKMASNTTEK